ncbi:hypothetical protein [Mesorhizobium sp. KR1-2]|uniref:hypothetical protein n=1 Tax=Mesorhizobium sp. KR1-2 TaxID=3156609 RepID=UPI0032B4A902
MSIPTTEALVASIFLTASSFELSSSYVPLSKLHPGYYACRSGLDFSTFTFSFDVASDGSYQLRGDQGGGVVTILPENGTMEFKSGPFASDDTVKTAARNTTRVSDGNSVIIIRYDFGNVITDDYCALVK